EPAFPQVRAVPLSTGAVGGRWMAAGRLGMTRRSTHPVPRLGPPCPPDPPGYPLGFYRLSTGYMSLLSIGAAAVHTASPGHARFFSGYPPVFRRSVPW